MPVKTSFEETLRQLETAVERLESGELKLDEALNCFEQGVKSANLCRKQLESVAARVEVLLAAKDGTLRTEPFPEL
ncbi:MAG: exodeoxyribonuclease VII small subunit [Desulfuromonadales bacterium GWD2_61_12]|nr:MAG: exodeoxyribonuclease VII small subunit [Desulfuromonadales bacterium GWD2_61_12]